MYTLTIDLLQITMIICFIIDISGFIEVLKQLLFRQLKGSKISYKPYSLKPLDCSLCMTWWSGLLYILLTQQITLSAILIVMLMAYFAEIITNLMMLVKDLIGNLINKIYDKLH